MVTDHEKTVVQLLEHVDVIDKQKCPVFIFDGQFFVARGFYSRKIYYLVNPDYFVYFEGQYTFSCQKF